MHIRSICDPSGREVTRSCYGQMILCDNSGRRQTRGCEKKGALQVARNWQRFGCHTLHNILRGLSRSRCSTAHDSCLPRPQSCSRDVDGRLWGADGWQPKSSQQHLAGENQPAGCDPESNRGCPGPLTSRVRGVAQRRLLNISDQENHRCRNLAFHSKEFLTRRESDSVNIFIEKTTQPCCDTCLKPTFILFRNEVRVVRTATSKQDLQQKEGEAELGTAMLQFSNVGENNNTKTLVLPS